MSGGGAGGGKTYGQLLEALRHINVPGFGAVIFRREYPQITNQGGLWDTSEEIYPYFGGKPRLTSLEWVFPSGAKIKFAHMQREADRLSWDGSQIPLICFDQLEHFTERMYTYMLSRNRSTCGIRPYVRATCNPDPDHFLRKMLSWWIDDETGLPILDRSGVIRWYVMLDNERHWADTRQELINRHGSGVLPKSFTFIPSRVDDNKILLDKDPGYLANLEALSKVDRERLRWGNWNAREAAGMFFRRQWFEIVEAAPTFVESVRYWDRAGTESDKAKETGSWTAGCHMGVDADGVFYVADVARFQESPLGVKRQIKNVATQDGRRVKVGIEQDPGQAGKAEAQDQIRSLAGFDARVNVVRESKGMRAKPVSAQAEAGNVKLLRGEWNEAFIRECENFDGSDKCMADQVDALSGAFHVLTNKAPRPRVTWV